MKSLKFLCLLTFTAGLSFLFSSCKKDNDTVTTVSKEQLIGKYKMVVQGAGGTQTWNAELKASGAMEMDAAPYDGIADLIILWDVSGNNFSGHVDANGITNYWELHAPIDVKTLSMAGQIKVNDPNSPQSALFTMEKQ